ncbi:MAG: hypothetical protein IPM12_04760 [Flavobacteriales bacterium]|nr:hypothetical protein [Flavobacteriales bacterium]
MPYRQGLRRALCELGHQGHARRQACLPAGRLKDFHFKPHLDGYAIKVPVFSFDKFPNVDKSLGPEMKSTGEAIYFIKDLKDPFFRQVYGERSMYLSR